LPLGQLLRRLAPGLEERRDLVAGAFHPGRFGMRMANGDARHEATALDILGGEATPAPMVLELIEGIFRVGAITIE
jgi:hypothetical protein